MTQDIRFTATVDNDPATKRLMLHGLKDGTALLYQFDSLFDNGCSSDSYFSSLQDAIDAIGEDYGVGVLEWYAVERPFPHCQDDWVTPARIPGRESGNPEWGRLELYLGGQWQELDMTKPSRIKIDYSLLKKVSLSEYATR